MNRKSSRMVIIERSLLKSILPCLKGGTDWASPLLMLGRVSSVSYENKPSKIEKKPKCIVCSAPHDNFLLYVLHLQLVHKGDINIQRYEFFQEQMTIYYSGSIKNNRKGSKREVRNLGTKEYFFGMNFQDRVKNIFLPILAKFTKKNQQHKRQYFHSIDIFREVGAESADEDSGEDLTNLERELERLRICDFSDVTETDKKFFIQWNQLVYQTKKYNAVIRHPEMMKMLSRFGREGQRAGVKRLNMVMHGWTLWSTGKISADDVTLFLNEYDSAQTE